jgi:ketosteroid isomerase-like protein
MHPAMESPLRQGPGRDHPPALLDRIRRALDEQDLESLAALYAEDAVLEQVSSLSPPSHPKVSRGRDAILECFRAEILRDPVSGWERHLQSSVIIDAVETDEAVAFTEVRTYAAGDKVLAQHLAHKHAGRIERDRMVIAWDAD